MNSTIFTDTGLDMDLVNFDNADEVCRFASQILEKANSIGLFLQGTSRQSREAVRIISLARDWVNTVRTHIPTYSAGDALMLTDAYDLMHRIAFRRPADNEYLNSIRLAAFEARIHGDKTVDEYALYRTIRSAVLRGDTAFLGRPAKWMCLCTDRWHKRLSAMLSHSVLAADAHPAADYDTLQQAAILMEADLRAYEGSNQTAFKRRLSTRYRKYLRPNPSTMP